MTQPALDFALKQDTPPQSFCDRLEAYFKARPNTWIDGMTLARIAGQYAWRSRVSDLRKRGMAITNRQRVQREHRSGCPLLLFWDATDEGARCTCDTPRTFTVSEYMFTEAQ